MKISLKTCIIHRLGITAITQHCNRMTYSWLIPWVANWCLFITHDVLISQLHNSLYLLDVLLEQPQPQTLMKLDLLGVPDVLQVTLMRQDFVDHVQHMTCCLRVIRFSGDGVGTGGAHRSLKSVQQSLAITAHL